MKDKPYKTCFANNSLILLFLFLACFGLNSQTDAIKISGKVTDQSDPDEIPKCVFVTLSFEGKEYKSVECDSLGNYELEIPAELFKNQTGKLSVNQDKKCLQAKTKTDKDCPYFVSRPIEYFTNNDYKFIKTDGGNTKFKADFNLVKLIIEYRYPNTFYFKKNSLETMKLDEFHPDTALMCAIFLLKENQTLFVELRGHAWHESGEKQLAKKRALFILNKFIEAGIDSNRFVVTISDGYILSDIDIKRQAKTEDERKRLSSLNRRVTLIIRSFDYDPKLKRRVEQKPKKNDEEGDD